MEKNNAFRRTARRLVGYRDEQSYEERNARSSAANWLIASPLVGVLALAADDVVSSCAKTPTHAGFIIAASVILGPVGAAIAAPIAVSRMRRKNERVRFNMSPATRRYVDNLEQTPCP